MSLHDTPSDRRESDSNDGPPAGRHGGHRDESQIDRPMDPTDPASPESEESPRRRDALSDVGTTGSNDEPTGDTERRAQEPVNGIDTNTEVVSAADHDSVRPGATVGSANRDRSRDSSEFTGSERFCGMQSRLGRPSAPSEYRFVGYAVSDTANRTRWAANGAERSGGTDSERASCVAQPSAYLAPD